MKTRHCFKTAGVVLGALMRPLALAVILFASASVVGVIPNLQAEEKECSNASLKGTYGFYSTATVVPAGTPRVVVARHTYDGKGNLFFTFTANDNGTVTRGTALGHTYTVNTDCTGAAFDNQGQEYAHFVLVDGGKEFYLIRTSPAAIVLTGVGKKQFPEDDEED